MTVNTRTRSLIIAISLGLFLPGLAAYASTTVVLAVGTIPQSQFFDGPATITVRTLTIKPGEVLAWHYHPGYAFNVVKSGTLTVEEGCGGEETLTPGQGFEELEGTVHRAKNLSTTEDVVIYNTFIVPQGRPTTVNIPGNERRCGPPNTVSDCAEAWATFTQPRTFDNQGDCTSYVRHRPYNVVPLPEDPQQ